MSLYIVRNTEQRCSLTLANQDEIELFTSKLDFGEPLNKAVSFIELRALKSDQISYTNDVPTEDFPVFIGLTVSVKARSKIESLIGHLGEWIELRLAAHKFYYFNVTTMVEALDLEKTQFLEENGSRFAIVKPVFKDMDFSNFPIFKLLEMPHYHSIVTEKFVQFVEQHKLTGLKFKKVSPK